jgi:hypothetical protein
MKSLLLFLISLVCITSILGGLQMIAFQNGTSMGLQPGLLKHTPFESFLIPGVILTVAVGGSSFSAFSAILQRQDAGFIRAAIAGAILCTWIIIQVLLIRQSEWLHAVYLFTGLLIIFIAFKLKGSPQNSRTHD